MLSRGIELRCAAKLRYRTRRFARFEERSSGPSISQPPELSANTHDEVEQRRRCYIIIVSRCAAVQWRGQARQFRLLSRKKQREGKIWQKRLVFNSADDQFLFLLVVFSPSRRVQKSPAKREQREDCRSNWERLCLVFFLSQILLVFLDKDHFAIYFFFVHIFLRDLNDFKSLNINKIISFGTDKKTLDVSYLLFLWLLGNRNFQISLSTILRFQ